MYVIEDVICIRDKLEPFYNFTKYLSKWRADVGGDNCVDPFKILKKTKKVFEYSIDKIEYGCSYIAIHKKLRKHWIE
jgi:hypothetical protein